MNKPLARAEVEAMSTRDYLNFKLGEGTASPPTETDADLDADESLTPDQRDLYKKLLGRRRSSTTDEWNAFLDLVVAGWKRSDYKKQDIEKIFAPFKTANDNFKYAITHLGARPADLISAVDAALKSGTDAALASPARPMPAIYTTEAILQFGNAVLVNDINRVNELRWAMFRGIEEGERLAKAAAVAAVSE